MIVDGVCFVEAAVAEQTKDEFIARHTKVLWQDIAKKDRDRKLSDVYDMCTKKEDTPG